MESGKLLVPVAIYIPAGDREFGRWLNDCSAHMRTQAWELESIASNVDTLARLWSDGRIRRVVTALPEHAQSLLWPVEVVHRSDGGPPDPVRVRFLR